MLVEEARGCRSRDRCRRRSGETISHSVVHSGYMNFRAGELSQDGQVALLLGLRFVVGKYSEFSTFQHKIEVTERRVGGEELSVKGTVLPLSIRQLLGEEGQGRSGPIQELLQNRTPAPPWRNFL